MGCWFGGPQHWKMVAGLVVPSIGRWLLVWWSTALVDGCWLGGPQHWKMVAGLLVDQHLLSFRCRDYPS